MSFQHRVGYLRRILSTTLEFLLFCKPSGNNRSFHCNPLFLFGFASSTFFLLCLRGRIEAQQWWQKLEPKKTSSIICSQGWIIYLCLCHKCQSTSLCKKKCLKLQQQAHDKFPWFHHSLHSFEGSPLNWWIIFHFSISPYQLPIWFEQNLKGVQTRLSCCLPILRTKYSSIESASDYLDIFSH